MLKRKHFRRMIATVLTTSTLLATAISVNATTVSHYIDNDDAQDYKTEKNGFSTYLSSGYRGDSRMQSSSNTSAYYKWWFPFFVTQNTVSWKFMVYLANPSFTDPSAEYRIHGGENMYIEFKILHINQDKAANGWNEYYGTRSVTVGKASLGPNYVKLIPSEKSGYNTGADGVYVKFTY